MVNELSVNLNSDSYGNVLRSGKLPDGRIAYKVIDSDGKDVGKISIPNDQVDTFEASYKQILDSAPEIRQYVKTNSTEAAIKKRRNIARCIVAASGLVGVTIPLIILRNSTSVTKKILGMVAGIVAGLSAGFIASLGVTTPPGSLKFARATRQLSELDIRSVPNKDA